MPAVEYNSRGSVLPKALKATYIKNGDVPILHDLHVNSYTADSVWTEIVYENTDYPWLDLLPNTYNFQYYDYYTFATLLEAEYLKFLEPGEYTARILFHFEKYGADDSVFEVVVSLTVDGNSLLQTDKRIYNLLYNKETGSMSGDLDAQILNNTTGKMLDVSISSPAFKSYQDITNGFAIAEGSPGAYAQAFSSSDGAEKTFSGFVKNKDGNIESTFYIVVNVILNDFSITPNRLDFEIANVGTEATKILKIINSWQRNFNITFPWWLSLSSSSGSSSQDIAVTTHTVNLQPGTYNGDIQIVYDGNTAIVPVSLLVKNSIQVSDEEFCLDFKDLTFTRISEGAVYVRIKAKFTYEVLGKTEILFKEFIVPYVNDAAYFPIGKKAHKYFPRFDTFVETSINVYCKKIKVDIEVNELNADFQVLKSATVPSLYLLPGRKPLGYPLLSNVLHRRTVSGTQVLLPKKEADGVSVVKKTASGNESFDEQTLKFYPFPNVFRKIEVQYENENLMPDWALFTGEYSINPDYSHLYSKSIFFGKNEKYDTTQLKTLKVNTGFILYAEKRIIENIVKSRVVFIKIDETVYKCFCTSNKLTMESSEEETVSYDLEFLIVE